MAAADQAKLRLVLLVLGLGQLQPFGEARIGAPGMEHALERRHLLGPLLGGTARHHRLLVPGEPAHDLRQRLGLALIVHQFGEGDVGAHSVPFRIEPTRGYSAR